MSATTRYDMPGNRPLRFPSQPMRECSPKMKWNERIAASFDARGVNRAEVGREIGITGQAITLKLQGKRPTYVEELKIMSRWAGMTVAEALGDRAWTPLRRSATWQRSWMSAWPSSDFTRS